MSEAPLEFSLLIASGIPTRSFIADGVIFREGDKAEELYVIQSGTVEISTAESPPDTVSSPM